MQEAHLSREYFGFSQFFAVTFLLGFIIFWSLLPDLSIYQSDDSKNELFTFVHELVNLLPQRAWIIVINCVILMGMLFIYLGLLSYNEDVLTAPLDDLTTVTDSRANVVPCSTHEEFLQKYAFQETSGVLDVPITEVCKLLYGRQ
ncbi:LADA_0G08658g1_1 [Lachancea dasiensis]|uniref:Phosphatidylinositol N-acetylglucosaminyltransferase subunit GPI19 n=1 Tax=Lachancea dasiensis TaxID=1072105 RepID=A0A1G4JU54_9SACH|nr:LADA_0G08658g1_1 [Lachancea dasiensis]